MKALNKCFATLCLYAFCAAACSKDDPAVIPTPPVPAVAIASVSSFVPATATAGDPIKITGTKFTGATVVMIGNMPAQSFQVISDTEIMAYVANAGASSGKVAVTAPAGNADAAGFTYYTHQHDGSTFRFV
jgi:hypothetical protein